MSMASGLPRHLRSPGDEGFRTPTIEDAEFDLSTHNQASANIEKLFPSAGRKVRDVHTSALEALHNPAFRAPEGRTTVTYASDRAEESDTSIPPRRRHSSPPPVNLSWKKRIRHVTWAYFTLTMATGGVANVLWTGMMHSRLLSWTRLTA